MSAVQIQFVFLQQTAAGRQKIAEAEQEQLAGSGHSGMLSVIISMANHYISSHSSKLDLIFCVNKTDNFSLFSHNNLLHCQRRNN